MSTLDTETARKSVTATGSGPLHRICHNRDGTERKIIGIGLIDWGIVIGCFALLYVFLGLFYAALLNISTGVRQEDWILMANDRFGPFDREDRYLLDPHGNKIPILAPPDDVTLAFDETIYRKYSRPDGCIAKTIGSPEANVLVCDESGKAAKNRWLVNPWLLDLAASPIWMYENAACSFTEAGTSILEVNGLVYGENACVNGISIY